MPKNVNEKALAAKERKAASKEGKEKEAAKAKEDSYWVGLSFMGGAACLLALDFCCTALEEGAREEIL